MEDFSVNQALLDKFLVIKGNQPTPKKQKKGFERWLKYVQSWKPYQ